MIASIKMGGDEAANDEALRKKIEEMNNQKRLEKENEDALDGVGEETEEEVEKDLSSLTKDQLEQYERVNGVIQTLKS